MNGGAQGREVHLVRRPTGWPVPQDFELVAVDVAEPRPGGVAVRNRFFSVDPYMRGRMNDVPSYLPPFQLGAPLAGEAIGEVVASASDRFAPGDLVAHAYGWREYVVGGADRFARLEPLAGVPVETYLGALGTPGLTAYVGLFEIAAFGRGDVVFVSGAAGAVGSVVGQLARLHGAGAVIGSAGSAAKVAQLTGALRFDRAFDYRDGEPRALLTEAAGERGIDVYFDNVGGAQLEAALGRLNVGGRVALCGAVSQYNAVTPSPGPRNLGLAISKRLTLRGFLVLDHLDRMSEFRAEVAPAVRDGRLLALQTVVDGIEHAVEAFLGMLRGANVGKMLVRLPA